MTTIRLFDCPECDVLHVSRDCPVKPGAPGSDPRSYEAAVRRRQERAAAPQVRRQGPSIMGLLAEALGEGDPS